MRKSSVRGNCDMAIRFLLMVLFALVVVEVQCILLPQVWVRTLQLVCTAVDSNADLLGTPIPRDIRTFPSLAGLQEVENEQVK